MALLLGYQLGQSMRRSRTDPDLLGSVLCQLLERRDDLVVRLDGNLNVVCCEVFTNFIGDSRRFDEEENILISDDGVREEDWIGTYIGTAKIEEV